MLLVFRGAAAALVWAVAANGANAAPCSGTNISESFIEKDLLTACPVSLVK